MGQDPSRPSFHTVSYESEVYRLFARVRGGDGVAPFLPASHGFDAEEQVFLLGLLHDSTSLLQLYFDTSRFEAAHGERMAEVLANLHGIALSDVVAAGFPLEQSPAPTILQIHRPHLRSLEHLSATNIQFVQIVQRFPEIGAALDELSATWVEDGLIHGDVKWENFNLCASRPGGPRDQLKLLDWETAGAGDTAWDVGSVFGAYLSSWILTMPVTGELPPESFVALARFPLVDMQPAMRAFWARYVERRGWDADESSRRLARVMPFVAARLILTAFEQLQSVSRISGSAIALLQVASNVFERPDDAAQHLLGLQPAAASGEATR